MSRDNAGDRRRFWGGPVPEGLKHGPTTRASRIYGCPCTLCLPSGKRKHRGNPEPHKVRQKRLRATKKGQPVPPGVKHGVYAARTYLCHCDICRSALRVTRHRKRTAWRETATGSWHDGPKKTVLHWPPVGQGRWTCPECGQVFRMREEVRRAEAA